MVSRVFPRMNVSQGDDQGNFVTKPDDNSGNKRFICAAAAVAMLAAGVAFLLIATDFDDARHSTCPPIPSATSDDPLLSRFMSSAHQQGHVDHTVAELAMEASHVILRSSTTLTSLFSGLRNGKVDSASARRAFNALVDLKGLEEPLRGVMMILGKHAVTGNSLAVENIWDQGNVQKVLSNAFIAALTEARQLAAHFQENTQFRRAAACYPDLLLGIETVLLEDDSKFDQYQLGLYWSHRAFKHSPFFGAPTIDQSTSAVDSWGSRVSESIAKAEQLMMGLTCNDLEPSQAKSLALRWREHAQFFLSTVDAVPVTAEVRYRAGASCAADAGLPRVASQLLARLGYFMSLRGRQSDALLVVGDALEHASDPLAAHLHAALSLSLGELHTDEDVAEAISKLKSAEGRMPPLGQLEEQRAALHQKLSFWGGLATAGNGIRGCFEQLTDVALLAICVVCRLIYSN